jgi:hypothetical protein
MDRSDLRDAADARAFESKIRVVGSHEHETAMARGKGRAE